MKLGTDHRNVKSYADIQNGNSAHTGRNNDVKMNNLKSMHAINEVQEQLSSKQESASTRNCVEKCVQTCECDITSTTLSYCSNFGEKIWPFF